MSFAAFLSPEEIAAIQQQEALKSGQKRTPEQIEAIYTHGQNVLVSASAGSGKTFVMVERIMDKIKRGIALNQLFISTFTVKAAGELKERIEKKLGEELAQTSDASLRRHLSAQLALMDQADIGTMDAFTQRLVTRYGYLLGISPQFRILQDDHEKALLMKEAYEDLFATYMAGEQQTLFQTLVRNFIGKRKDSKDFYDLVTKIYAFSQATSQPEAWLTDTFLVSYRQSSSLADVPVAMLDGVKRAILQVAEDLADLMEDPDYSKETKQGKPTANFVKHQKLLETLRDAADHLHDPEQLVAVLASLDASLPKTGIITVNKIAYPIFKPVQAPLKDLRHIETILTYQDRALPLLELLQDFVLAFSRSYFAIKQRENSYEFADIGHLAIAILEKDAGLRQQFQERYHEVMVDEYQDNNHTQERLLELLSNGHNRFMVGDIKQSIYRFRQADPQIFQDKFERYQAYPEEGKLILLKENFRSQQEVIEATNAVFTRLMDKEVGQIRYDEQHCLVAGSPKQTIAQPANQMAYLIYNDEAPPQEEGDDTESFTAGEVDMVIQEIIRLHQEEQVPFSQITLLVPSRTRNKAILTAFEHHGIPLVADGAETNYLESLEVMVMLDTLRVIANPLQDYALLALMKSPMFSFGEDELTRIALQAKEGNFYDKLLLAQDKTGDHPELILPALADKLDVFQSYLLNWRQFAKSHGLYDLIWKIFDQRFYYDYVGALPNGKKRQANLYALALRAHQFEQTGFKGLSRFIAMIDKIIANQHDLANVEEAPPSEAVQLMTIHKSKGLEFQYVFLLNMDKAFNTKDSSTSFILSREKGIGIQYVLDLPADKEKGLPATRLSMKTLPYLINQRELKLATLSEQMRLLYVAMTRAEKKLYLVGKGNPDKLLSQVAKAEKGVLLASTREQLRSFQEWILALYTAFPSKDLPFAVRFMSDEDLTPDKIGVLEAPALLSASDQSHNRQSEDIRQALEQLEAVEVLNQRYQAAIDLPSVRTPSQLKSLYEPVLLEEGVAQPLEVVSNPSFDLPDFSSSPAVTGAQIGSALHALMQAVPLDQPVTHSLLEELKSKLAVEAPVKDKLPLEKVLVFFETDLGRELQTQAKRVHREAPFALLQTDPVSQEQFVLRGIVDGFILYEDRIVLFDYKTDRYSQSETIVQRYKEQMNLYAQALRQAYGIEQISSYLVLLGGKDLEIVAC